MEMTARIHYLKLSGEFKTCESCAITNGRIGNLTNCGKIKVKPLESNYIWTSVPLRMQAKAGLSFGLKLLMIKTTIV
jgi:hypothetical protein